MTNMKETIGNYLRHIREIRLVAVCVAVSSLAASAYLAPVEERCGVRVEIGSFPQKTERPGNDCAVTWCNLAELYGKRDADDPRIEACLDRAWECLTDPALPLDGYHAFTLSKCIPTFDHYGWFLYAKKLRERMATIHAGT